jgi:hypothetical protein
VRFLRGPEGALGAGAVIGDVLNSGAEVVVVENEGGVAQGTKRKRSTTKTKPPLAKRSESTSPSPANCTTTN